MHDATSRLFSWVESASSPHHGGNEEDTRRLGKSVVVFFGRSRRGPFVVLVLVSLAPALRRGNARADVALPMHCAA